MSNEKDKQQSNSGKKDDIKLTPPKAGEWWYQQKGQSGGCWTSPDD